MTIATSIFMIAAGAILRYALEVNSDVINIPTVGLILMITGGAGLAISLLYEVMQSGPKGPKNQDYYDGDVGPDDRTRRLR